MKTVHRLAPILLACMGGTTGHAATPAAAPPKPGVMKPGVMKTFRDWTVACDNGLRCTMASLGSEGVEFPAATLAITRDAGAAGAYSVTAFYQGEADPGPVPTTLVIDGRRFALSGDVAAIPAALAAGRLAVVQDRSGKAIGTVSVAGASAALRYIDALQGRANGVTATVAKGSAPAASVPAAPALPIVRAITPGGTAARPTAAQLATMKRIGGCDDPDIAGDPARSRPDLHAVGGGKTLVLLPCSGGAYNFSSLAFVLDGAGVRAVTVDVATGIDPDRPAGPAELVNAAFEGGVITTFAKARGLGDCGVAQTLAWDGTRLRLIEQREMEECRGNTNWVTTWRAQPVRG